MQVPRGNNAGPGSDTVWPKLMSEEKERFLGKKKANVTIFEFNFILPEIFITEWTHSLKGDFKKCKSLSIKFQGRFMEVLRVLKGCYETFLNVFQRSLIYLGVLQVFF